jgi:secreted PhoX family phosphatase
MKKLHIKIKLSILSSTIALTLIQLYQAHAVDVQFQNTPPYSSNKLAVSSRVKINGRYQELGFKELFRTGDKDNGETYGLMKDHTGAPAKSGAGVPYICSGNTPGVIGSGTDFTALLEKEGKTYLISQFECPTGGMYYAELNNKTGVLSPETNTLKFIDQEAEWGGWVHCAGSVTPWNTYLGGEEYEPDARIIEGQSYRDLDRDERYYKDKVHSYWLENISKSSPYHNGWITEVDIISGNAHFKKHYAMGRFSHELGYVMPDKRTVYLTDDGTNNVLFMFVAKTAENLTEGSLYAAKWNQTSAYNGGSATLEWINLGNAKSNDIRPYIATGTVFSDLFFMDSVACKKIAANGKAECLEVKPGMKRLASRLESRRYAALKGATHEFRKMEGFTFDPVRNQAFLAISELGRGMLNNINDSVIIKKNYDDLDGNGTPETGNHISINNADYCGAIYSMDVGTANDSDGTPIASTLVALNMNAILASGTKPGKISPKECASQKRVMAQPDNITMMPNSNILLIGEDGKHTNNMVWSFDLESHKLERIATAPEGAETTSLYFHKVGDFSYMTLVAQHPDESNENPDGASITGIVGPMILEE